MNKVNEKEVSIWMMIGYFIITIIVVVGAITLMGNVKRGNVACPQISNSTQDPSMPFPFSNKCIGLTNYLAVDDNGHYKVKRGIVIR